MDRNKFEKIMELSKDRRYNIDAIAVETGVSVRQVNRVKEAGTWERWPYIQAKIKHGYNTPEYKTYLKRRGLPLTPPPKLMSANAKGFGTPTPPKTRQAVLPVKQPNFLARLFKRGK